MVRFAPAVAVAVLAGSVLVGGAARADVLFDSVTGLVAFAGDPIGPATSTNGAGAVYASFSTGSQAETLASVELALSAATPSDGGVLSVSLWSDIDSIAPDAGPGPLTLLESLGTIDDSIISSADPTDPTLITLSLSTSVTLDADTRYWIEIDSGTTASSAVWSWTLGDSADAGPVVANEYTENAGTGYKVNPNAEGIAYMMVVDPVPEPTAFSLLAFGILGLGIGRRVSRARQA